MLNFDLITKVPDGIMLPADFEKLGDLVAAKLQELQVVKIERKGSNFSLVLSDKQEIPGKMGSRTSLDKKITCVCVLRGAVCKVTQMSGISVRAPMLKTQMALIGLESSVDEMGNISTAAQLKKGPFTFKLSVKIDKDGNVLSISR